MIIIILLILMLFTMTLIYFSKLKIEIHDLKKEDVLESYLIYLNLYILNVKYFTYKLDKSKIEKLKKSKKVSEIINKQFKKNYKKQLKIIWKDRRKIKLDIEKLKLKIELGNKNPIITSYKMAFWSNFVSKILLRTVSKKNYKYISYKILPCYNNKNYFKFELNCIISVKIAHIIKVINKFKKGSELNNGRTSNRRSNDNCYG